MHHQDSWHTPPAVTDDPMYFIDWAYEDAMRLLEAMPGTDQPFPYRVTNIGLAS